MQKIINLLICLSLFLGMAACVSTNANLSENQQGLIYSLKQLEKQKQQNMSLPNLMTLGPFQPLENIPVVFTDLLNSALENYEENNLDDEASEFFLHKELKLLALSNGEADSIKVYRPNGAQAIELGLYYDGIDDMKRRLEEHQLSGTATLSQAIEQGVFDVGKVYFAPPKDGFVDPYKDFFK